jgi:molybdate transport system substrate-binding protein
MKFKSLILAGMLLTFAVAAQAEGLRTAAGAGYKKFVEQWTHLYEDSTGTKVERIYGNMGQVTAQIMQGGGICLVVGDKSYLSTHGLPIAEYVHVGQGRPVLVTRQGLTISTFDDLSRAEFERISAPDFEKAIYGRAARQILAQKRYQQIRDKVMPVGTVPRSGAYAISSEVDAAFINLSYALANKDKFGSMLELTSGFEPIEIVAGIIKGCEDRADLKQFIELLQSDVMNNNRVAAGL